MNSTAAPEADPAAINEVRPAVGELVALVYVMRPHWSPHQVRAVINRAAAIGMTWTQVCLGLVRIAVDAESQDPDELIPGYLHPRHRRGGDPEIAHQGAERVRAAFNTAKASARRSRPRG